jgi:hypothetical protein
VQGVAEQMEHEIELIVSCYGWLTSMVGVFIVLETLGIVEGLCGFVLLGNGRIGFALQ